MIEFVEKEPFKDYDNWNNRNCLMYPNVLVKDGKEYFIMNRREPQGSSNHREITEVIDQLRENNGAYLTFYGSYIQLMDFLSYIIKNQYSFDKTFETFEEYKKGNFVDFSRKS